MSDDDAKRNYLKGVESDLLISTILQLLTVVKPKSDFPPPAPSNDYQAQSSAKTTFANFMAEHQRRCSIVISGLPESTNSNPTEKLEEEHSKIFKFLDLFGIKSFDTTFRMGRFAEGKTRLVKVVLNSVGAQKHLLQNAFVLKNAAEFRGVYVRESLSNSQRILYKKLLQLRRSLLTKTPSRKLFIRNLKLFDGQTKRLIAKVAPDNMNIICLETDSGPASQAEVKSQPFNDIFVNKNPRRKDTSQAKSSSDVKQTPRELN